VEGRFPGLRVERVRIKELAKDYVRDYEINGWTSIKDAQRYLRVLTEVFGPLRVVELRLDQIAAYIDQRRKARLPSTSTLSSPCRTWHMRQSLLNPAHERFRGLGI